MEAVDESEGGLSRVGVDGASLPVAEVDCIGGGGWVLWGWRELPPESSDLLDFGGVLKGDLKGWVSLATDASRRRRLGAGVDMSRVRLLVLWVSGGFGLRHGEALAYAALKGDDVHSKFKWVS